MMSQTAHVKVHLVSSGVRSNIHVLVCVSTLDSYIDTMA